MGMDGGLVGGFGQLVKDWMSEGHIGSCFSDLIGGGCGGSIPAINGSWLDCLDVCWEKPLGEGDG
jgi:hypothetical protein